MASPRTSLQETDCSACSVSWGCTWCLESCSYSWWCERLSTVQKHRRRSLSHKCAETRKCAHREAFHATDVVVLFSSDNDHRLCSARRLRSGRRDSTAIRDPDGPRDKSGAAFYRAVW